jgi:hypothetical protein
MPRNNEREQHRLALHPSRLAQAVNPYNLEYRDTAHALANVFARWQKQID